MKITSVHSKWLLGTGSGVGRIAAPVWLLPAGMAPLANACHRQSPGASFLCRRIGDSISKDFSEMVMSPESGNRDFIDDLPTATGMPEAPPGAEAAALR